MSTLGTGTLGSGTLGDAGGSTALRIRETTAAPVSAFSSAAPDHTFTSTPQARAYVSKVKGTP